MIFCYPGQHQSFSSTLVPVTSKCPSAESFILCAQSEYYYVDKTLLIKEFLDQKPLVSLFTRPRRFGKTLNMDMLRVFFEISEEDTGKYFQDKAIWKCGEEYRKHQGQYPVIYLTFKDGIRIFGKASDYGKCNRQSICGHEFGFINPVIIDGENNIIAGHGRVMAAKEEKIAEVPCVLVEHLTPAQKKAYILADNRMAMDAGWDEELLRIEIEALQAEAFDIGLTGFEEQELVDLFASEEDNEVEDDDFDLNDALEKAAFVLLLTQDSILLAAASG